MYIPPPLVDNILLVKELCGSGFIYGDSRNLFPLLDHYKQDWQPYLVDVDVDPVETAIKTQTVLSDLNGS